MAVYFTADTHFGHTAILEYEKGRVFRNVDEHDRHLIDRWNAVVTPKDVVWHLGDFALCDADRAAWVFRRLNGDKRIVLGNHDKRAVTDLPWGSQHRYHEMSVDGQRVILFHYGQRVWNAMRHGAVALYGHSHGRLPGNRQTLDVGVDAWDFAPVSWDQIQARLQTLPALAFGSESDEPVREITWTFGLTPWGELHIFKHGEMPEASNLVRVRFLDHGDLVEAKAEDIVELRNLLGTAHIETVVRPDPGTVPELEGIIDFIQRRINKIEGFEP